MKYWPVYIHLTSTEERASRTTSGLRIFPRSRMKNDPALELGSPVPGAKGIRDSYGGPRPCTARQASFVLADNSLRTVYSPK